MPPRAFRNPSKFRGRVFVIGAIVGVALVSAVRSESESGQPPPESSQATSRDIRMEDQGQEHVAPGQPHVDYNSVPATSGPHFGQPLAPARWGVHTQHLPDEVLVHNLEHGYVNVHYRCPELCPQLVGQLSAIIEDTGAQGAKVLLSPYLDMDAQVALTAWTFIETMDAFDEERVRAFIRAHESSRDAPEYNVGGSGDHQAIFIARLNLTFAHHPRQFASFAVRHAGRGAAYSLIVPLVLGTCRPRLGSGSTASRMDLARLLNIASALWWLLTPEMSRTCRFKPPSRAMDSRK